MPDDPPAAPPMVRATEEPLEGPARLGGNVAVAPARIKIGYVYSASITVDGVKQTYTGSTAQELIKRITKTHKRWKFLSDPTCEIEVYEVRARLNIEQSTRQSFLSARKEALSTVEQEIIDLKGKAGDTIVNDIRAASVPNMKQWSAAHQPVQGEITVETAPRYVVKIGEKWILRGPWLGKAMGSLFSGLDIIQVFLMYRDMKMSQYVMAPYVLEDECGVFTLRWQHHWLTANGHFKHYETGPHAGEDVAIESDEFDFWKEEAESLWGYADWKADFVPGVLRRNLPEMDPVTDYA